ncbi:related to Putative oligopeptide transporter YGL114W [Saccharomycodes ludwigii]|uniref:Related to Putative oligopeptide transporter YGL114W n=1 Tax=Saccharomycodes ludwigii TaxID=36035 RepID=A0A376B7I9_9ASCO|nr:related to Putative oligopeptide transporter YGL114W [Saccharomycodes ludwigii]
MAQPNAEQQAVEWEDKAFIKQVTLRGTVVGLIIGSFVLISNFQFGLQTGWVSMMSLPSALLACAIFKQVYPKIVSPQRLVDQPFTDVENVYIQSIAVAVGTGPLALGFVGVIPAIEKFLTKEESGGFITGEDGGTSLSLTKLIIWSIALAFFGVFFAVPLRKQVIIKEKLPFPSGSATATLISVLNDSEILHEVPKSELRKIYYEYNEVLRSEDRESSATGEGNNGTPSLGPAGDDINDTTTNTTYNENLKILIRTFTVSSIYTLVSYFIPIIKAIPIFGSYLNENYLWNFQPSPAYIGQGIIMGLPTTSYMLFGCVLGWGIMAPLCKFFKLVDPDAEVNDWENGIQGWILWCSLSVMVVDSCVGFIVVTVKSVLKWYFEHREGMYEKLPSIFSAQDIFGGNSSLGEQHLLIAEGTSNSPILTAPCSNGHNSISNDTSPMAKKSQLSLLDGDNGESQSGGLYEVHSNTMVRMKSLNGASAVSGGTSMARGNSVIYMSKEHDHDVKDPKYLIKYTTVFSGIIISSIVCIISMVYIYGIAIIPIYSIILALILALFLSVLAVRALGETDLNPVSGIGKLSQLIFALITPRNKPGAVLLNLIAGAIAEAGAQQAGDLMQDLKTGHLLGASPKAQFIAQMIGASWSIVLSSVMYVLYNKVYDIPNENFRIPTAVIWIDCARLVLGNGLPRGATTTSVVLGIIFGIISFVKNIYRDHDKDENKFIGKMLLYLPSGVAVGVGIYNTPSFTIARFIGGLIGYIWVTQKKCNRTTIIVFSSGLVLGEGICSIFNMVFSSFNVPHL